METREQICKIFPREMREMLSNGDMDFDRLCAVRVRAGRPFIFEMEDGERFIDGEGRLTRNVKSALHINTEDIKKMLEFICSFSLYAYDDEMRAGYITIEGGHRVGIAGSVSLVEGHVDRMKYISCLNVRVAHEIRGCGDESLPYMYEEGVLQNTIIVSGCGRGKTTILRDIIRQISDGNGKHAGLSVGVVDELGGVSDLEAVRIAVTSGCKIIATIHGADMRELKSIPLMKKLLDEKMITRLIFLKQEGRPGQISGIYDGDGGELFVG